MNTVGPDGKSQREVRLCMEVWKILWYASLHRPTTLSVSTCKRASYCMYTYKLLGWTRACCVCFLWNTQRGKKIILHSQLLKETNRLFHFWELAVFILCTSSHVAKHNRNFDTKCEHDIKLQIHSTHVHSIYYSACVRACTRLARTGRPYGRYVTSIRVLGGFNINTLVNT